MIQPAFIYQLFEYLRRHSADFPGSGLMQYISFRSIAAAIVAIICSMLIGKHMIAYLHRKQIGEEIRDLGLEGQFRKEGTPTMGGLIIVISILIPVLLFANLSNIYIQMLIVTTIWLGALGFADDYIKTFKHNKDGLKPKYKLMGQIALGLFIALEMCFNPQARIVVTHHRTAEITEVAETGYSEVKTTENSKEDREETIEIGTTKTTIPFVKWNEFNYRWLSPFKGKFGTWFMWFIYCLVIIFIITACSNGSNLTDGMDGLDAGVSAICGATLGILAYLSGHTGYSQYLNIMYIPNSGEIAVFMSSMLGALLGFLWYNSYPAQIFMGIPGR
jgi:phospho-N-acetylmuramoyl-pentapeptide-transferase